MSKVLPILPLKDIIIFPNMVAPIFVGRKMSIAALTATEQIKDNDKNYILLSAQIDSACEEPKSKDIYTTGILAKILQTIKLPNNNARILVEAESRVLISRISNKNAWISGSYKVVEDEEISSYDDIENIEAIVNDIIILFKEYIDFNKKINPEIINKITENKPTYNHIINIISSNLQCEIKIKQELLIEVNLLKRAKLLYTFLQNEIAKNHAEQALQQRVKKQVEKNQREYYLNEQMKAIQKELEADSKSEFDEFARKINTLPLNKEAKEKAESELKKLRSMNQMSAESAVVRNYLEVLLSLPWGKFDNEKISITKTESVLNRDHFGLEKVKERIIEHLSVLKRHSKSQGTILCLIGPPGVGKTSLVKSIAESMGRKYAKFALGGVRDESEIRGHRKTYIGSMPGKIIHLLKKVNTSNPVILLDEIDKMNADFRGDPASALLEVLDPEQNNAFVDHYLEVEYDLSSVVFIATANTYNLPRPLLDRMEIINISGYIESEKLEIAKNYLIPKQRKRNGIKDNEIIITDDAILTLIRYYTKESGVRNLERSIGSLMRKVLKKILAKNIKNTIEISSNNIQEYLGIKKFKYGLAEESDQVGATTGLAYTELGGDLLTIEAVSFEGKGEVKTTGKLGEVMKESVSAAYSCFRTLAGNFGLNYKDYKDLDIHIHVPEGAVPKDGPSAGIAICTTIVSLMTKIPVRYDIAMTGEITLRGKVLAIGGLREKLLAAYRGGIKTVLIPEENLKDLEEIPSYIKDNIEIVAVSNINQVLDKALKK